LKTASFFTYSGPGRISIARFPPRNTPAGFKVYRALAPGPWFNSVEIAEYLERFHAEILAPLDPQAVWDELHRLAHPHEPVLLCWEKPPVAASEVLGHDFCHRRIVADWLEEKLGQRVEEYDPKQQVGQSALEL
jgi:hypothetical protein